MKPGPKPRPVAERLAAKVDQRGPDECWPWTGQVVRGGYGRLTVAGKVVLAHRLAWEIAHGPIPDGLWVLHRCDNPPCCNPRHLFLGDHAANMADMAAKNRGKGQRLMGVNNPRSKLSDSQVAEIRRRCEEGEVQRVVADAFGVTQANVSSIMNGRTRSYVGSAP